MFDGLKKKKELKKIIEDSALAEKKYLDSIKDYTDSGMVEVIASNPYYTVLNVANSFYALSLHETLGDMGFASYILSKKVIDFGTDSYYNLLALRKTRDDILRKGLFEFHSEKAKKYIAEQYAFTLANGPSEVISVEFEENIKKKTKKFKGR